MYDPLDQRGVPVSRGIPSVVHVAAIIGILAIFAIGAAVIFNASYGHHWPAARTLRVDLTGHNG